MKRHYYVTGYLGEGAKRMLLDLEQMPEVELIDRVIENRLVRFLYYRLEKLTHNFKNAHFLKKIFYLWYTISKLKYSEEDQDCMIFLNSGFCRAFDSDFVTYFKKKHQKVKLILYIVDPMSGFQTVDNRKVISMMDLVYSINRADCEKYGFHYYPLVYTRKDPIADKKVRDQAQMTQTDLYYLGSGRDRTVAIEQIFDNCAKEGICTDFHILDDQQPEETQHGIHYHNRPLAYDQNVAMLQNSNCILEIMHQDFDNPTQRYTEAIAYNKKLLTNNENTKNFPFYEKRYIQIFRKIEEIDWSFVKKTDVVEYDYHGEFSPCYFVKQIEKDLEKDRKDGFDKETGLYI